MGRRVVVVGGGVAGLHAARLLARRGAEVVVLERRSVLGGKVRTVRGDGCHFEAGPMRILDAHGTLRGVLADLGVATREFVGDNPDAPTVIRGEVGRLGDLCAGTLADAGVVRGDDLRASGLPRSASINDVVRLTLGSAAVPDDCLGMNAVEFCCRPASPETMARGRVALEVLKLRSSLGAYRTRIMGSMRDFADRLPAGKTHTFSPGKVHEVTDGLDTFVAALADRVAGSGSVQVRRMCLVEEVRRRPRGGVSLRCRVAGGRRESVDADAALLTCHGLAKLRFDPPLDAPLAAAVAAMQPADAAKMLLRFRTRFWERPPYNITGGIAQLDGKIGGIGKIYYPGPQPGPEGQLMVYLLSSADVTEWRRLPHSQRVDLYLGAIQALHPATDVRGLFIDVEEHFWFGPWTRAGGQEVEDAVRAGGDRGGVFIAGPPRAWMDEAMVEAEAAAGRAARFLRLPPGRSAARL